MTREEAKEILEEVKVLDDSMYQYNPAYLEALEMAIEALKDNQWQKGYDTATANANETKRSLVEMYEQQIEALKADPCERQLFIDRLHARLLLRDSLVAAGGEQVLREPQRRLAAFGGQEG